MTWAIRAAVTLAVILALGAIGVSGWLVERFHASKPRETGTVTLLAAPGTAQVVRDENGVAHIFGETDETVFYALGYTHASERFFQMDLVRRYVRGQLSALFGPDYLSVDSRTRTLGYGQLSQTLHETMSEETRAVVEAYVAGVNARLAEGNVAPEYAILRTAPDAWTVTDSAAVMISFADDLAAGRGPDMERARLRDILNKAQLDQFLAGYPDWGPTTLKDADVREAFSDIGTESLAPLPPLAQPDNLPGSNAWVVSGDRSETGAPLLANDPHLGLSTPSIWYYARLNLSDGPVIGTTAPGAPFVILGRNASIAWGFTNTGFDVIDLVERNPATLEITERTEEIFVKGRSAPQIITVRETAEGPILSPDWFDLSAFHPDLAVIQRSTLNQPGNRGADATYALMRAQSWDAFVEASRGYTVPMQNMHFAHVDGTIGYTTAGLLPIRDEETGDWSGFVPFEQLPRVVNPAGGLIASGNNLVAGEAYPYPLPGSYGVYRAPRIEAVLNAQPLHSLDSFSALQMDVVSEQVARIRPALLGAEPESQLGVEALARLEAWDGAMDADGPEALIMAAWLRVLSGAIWNDELGPEAARSFNQPRRAFLESVLMGEASAWCDNVRTEEMETCALTAGLALDAAMAETADAFGRDMSRWRWGDVHQGDFDHPFGDLPIVGAMFENRVGIPGDGSTVNVAHFSYRSGTYDVFHAASMRAIYDLADLNNSLYMHAPGQSGHPLSPHHGDLAERWAQGEYFQIRDDWDVERAPEGSRVLVLRPE
jgi:penicillin amidase